MFIFLLLSFVCSFVRSDFSLASSSFSFYLSAECLCSYQLILASFISTPHPHPHLVSFSYIFTHSSFASILFFFFPLLNVCVLLLILSSQKSSNWRERAYFLASDSFFCSHALSLLFILLLFCKWWCFFNTFLIHNILFSMNSLNLALFLLVVTLGLSFSLFITDFYESNRNIPYHD